MRFARKSSWSEVDETVPGFDSKAGAEDELARGRVEGNNSKLSGRCHVEHDNPREPAGRNGHGGGLGGVGVDQLGRRFSIRRHGYLIVE